MTLGSFYDDSKLTQIAELRKRIDFISVVSKKSVSSSVADNVPTNQAPLLS